MSTPSDTRSTHRSPARARVLAAATRLFYAEGIHTVGVDRIVTEAGVTRATFYRHFPGKEELVRSYIQEWDARIRAEAATATAAAAPAGVLALVITRLGQEMCGPGFRGCPFINAAAEYPDPANPVARAVAEHRAWLRSLLAELLTGAGAADAERKADILVLLRDGAMVGGALGDPALVARRLAQAVSAVLGEAGEPVGEAGEPTGTP
ncbi:TetR/AcrR family transcriptional regulator [Kitasatospora sp. NBC_01287]|uniref:TetR/AcrR family transcriptional regulator n=1 Tax=Kitasatospora sp. NBC_01287 TaxID=2903573 RepID=UPI002257281F|nr:TetR/AcrR family transcriptional regulator [Kitasatospora sp. NBC_01287]MCX4749841.1 TetR/AcrR family transcriptional regulator [Kitasatospora sp. NBC_01287]